MSKNRTIKVDEDTYRALMRVKGYLEMGTMRKVSLSDTIKEILARTELVLDLKALEPELKKKRDRRVEEKKM